MTDYVSRITHLEVDNGVENGGDNDGECGGDNDDVNNAGIFAVTYDVLALNGALGYR